MNLIIGSPPCNFFSKALGHNPSEEQIRQGLILVHEFERVVVDARPKLWGFENVARLERWFRKPQWRFMIGSQARRGLWTNIPIPLTPAFTFPNRILDTRTGRFFAKRRGLKPLDGQEFAKIPYPVARFIADTVHEAISQVETIPDSASKERTE